MGEAEKSRAVAGVANLRVGRGPRKNSVKRLPRITLAEVVIHGVLKMVWDDGYEGIVDLRPVIQRGKIFAYLQKPDNFQKFTVEKYGHHIGWIGDEGEEIDFGADSLRLKAENQAELFRLVSNTRY